MNLTMEILKNENEYVVKLNGEIDVYTASELKKKLLPLTEEKDVTIQVDLLHTTYLDSTGLGVFISAYKSSQENDSKLELINASDRILRLFKVTGLDRIMKLKETHVSREDYHG